MSLARLADVVATFQNHFNHYLEHGGGENALIGRRAEGSVSLQYSGRVVYELLQNALDRAHHRVIMRLEGQTLVVGNDGDGLSVDPFYDYSDPREGEGRSDFHALCALHTSNKNPERQFGNKGIGFRSVFGVSRRVRVWSRCADGGWWGMELVPQLVPAEWLGSDLSALAALDPRIIELGRSPRPSFHFPRPLQSREDPHDGCDGIDTVVLVAIEDDRHQRQIAEEVERLQHTRLQFVGLRRSGVVLHVDGRTIEPDAGWSFVSNERHHHGLSELAELASRAEHPIAAPTLAVAWAPEGKAEAQGTAGLFYNYLPMRMATGLPVDVHADFQVKTDRETMGLERGNAVGDYNLALLEHAARIHVQALRAEASKPRPRGDLWRLAGCPQEAPKVWREALREVLFPEKSFDAWVALAVGFFSVQREAAECSEFWNASRRWLEALTGYGDWTRTWHTKAQALCDKLSERGVAVIPVVAEAGTRTVALPSRSEQGRRADRRVFYWSPRGGEAIPPIPHVLIERGRVATSFSLGTFERPAGIQPFSETELLPELRQVPNDPRTLDASDPLSPEQQGTLLRFAFALTERRRASRSHFAWRAFADSQDEERIGRALSTMFLPTREGAWEPARQLTSDRIDRDRLATLMGSHSWDDLLLLLGVAPANGVPLVEGGEEGRVSPQNQPPRPQDAGSFPFGRLEPLLLPGTPLASVMTSLRGLPGDGPRSKVHEIVRATTWLSSSLFRTFAGVPALPEHVAPLDVVLHERDPQRIFFAVPERDEDRELLRALGALDQPDDERQRRVSHVLKGLRERIPVPAELPASVAWSLSALYNRLMSRLVDGESGVPLLVERSGRLAWLEPGEEAWVARREERQELRRFFPDLELIAAVHRDDLTARLGVKLVQLRKQIHPAIEREPPTGRALRIQRRIGEHLAVLAAVAEESRQATQTLDASRLLRAWQQPLVEVGDAWVEIRVEGPKRDPVAWRRGEFDDVFYLPAVEGDPGLILFDVDPQAEPDSDSPIPLRHFGDALAMLLVGNAGLGPEFAQVLASIDDGRIHDFVERHHLGGLVHEWTVKLKPLSHDERATLLQRLDRVCVSGEDVLARGRISAHDLRPQLEQISVRDLQHALCSGLSDRSVGFLPNIVIAHENRREWGQWYGRWKGSLVDLVESLHDLPSSWQSDLDAKVHDGLDQLHFSPSELVRAFLAEHGHFLDDLDRCLEEISPGFLAVTAAPRLASAAGWRAGHGRYAFGPAGPHRKMTVDDVVEEIRVLGAIGDEAERVFLKWVVDQTTPLQTSDGFAHALLSAFESGTRAWCEIHQALKQGRLEHALHVASWWSGAGFDVLGVEREGGTLVPVRYECKGIAATDRRVRVHLSRIELAVARRVRLEGPGRWMLIGIQPDGESIDLTGLITDLIDDPEALFRPLHDRGIEPDGVRLVVERP